MTTKFTPLKMGPSVDLTVCKLCKFEKDKVILTFVQTVSGMPVILEVEKWKEQSKRNVFASFLLARLRQFFRKSLYLQRFFRSMKSKYLVLHFVSHLTFGEEIIAGEWQKCQMRYFLCCLIEQSLPKITLV